MATSRPTGDEPYFRPEVHTFDARGRPTGREWWTGGAGPEKDQQIVNELKSQGKTDEEIEKAYWRGRGQKVGDWVQDFEGNPRQVPMFEQAHSLENRQNALAYGVAGAGAMARGLYGVEQLLNDAHLRNGSSPYPRFLGPGSTPIPYTQYTDAGSIPFLKHDPSAPRFSPKNVGKFLGRAGANATLTAALDYGVDAATKESRTNIGETIAGILKRKYGHEVDPITALTFYDQFMEQEGDLFHHKDVTTLGMQHDTAAGLMSAGVGAYNPVAGSGFNAARNFIEKPGRMAQYEMLADRMNSENTAGGIRDKAMMQYAGQYGVEGVKKRFPTLGWDDWKPKSGKE